MNKDADSSPEDRGRWGGGGTGGSRNMGMVFKSTKVRLRWGLFSPITNKGSEDRPCATGIPFFFSLSYSLVLTHRGNDSVI